MSTDSVTGHIVLINEMRLRIPGLTREEADRLAKDVVFWLERHLAYEAPKRKMEELNLRVHVSSTTPKRLMAEMIARQIREGLV